MEEGPPLPELPPSLQGILPGYRWAHGVGSVSLDGHRDQRGGAGKQEKLQRGARGREGQGGAALGEWQ